MRLSSDVHCSLTPRPARLRLRACNIRPLQKVEVVHSVAVLHDVLLDLGRIHPSHKVLHVPEQRKSVRAFLALIGSRISPCNQEGRVGHHLSSNSNMALLNELVGSADMLRHPQPSHDNTQSTSAESRNSDFPLNITELALSATTNAEQTHVVEFLEQLVLLLAAELALRGQQSNAVREMPQLAGQTVVRAVVVGVGERVAADNFCAAVAGIRRVVGEVDFAQELLLVVLELADHDCWCFTSDWNTGYPRCRGGRDEISMFACARVCRSALSFLERGRLDASRQIFGRRSDLHLSALSMCALTQRG